MSPSCTCCSPRRDNKETYSPATPCLSGTAVAPTCPAVTARPSAPQSAASWSFRTKPSSGPATIMAPRRIRPSTGKSATSSTPRNTAIMWKTDREDTRSAFANQTIQTPPLPRFAPIIDRRSGVSIATSGSKSNRLPPRSALFPLHPNQTERQIMVDTQLTLDHLHTLVRT
jgi:hypothetical protein